MKRVLQVLSILVAVAAVAAFAGGQGQEARPKLRIGTYDNRAIAVAFVRWKQNPMVARRAEHEAARCSGDRARVQALEEYGQKEQRKAHRQGFARVPVDDLLAQVRPGMARVAEARGLDAIAWFCDHAGPGVELVDVTDDLVALFEPTEETLTTVRELRRHEPIDLDEVEGGHDH